MKTNLTENTKAIVSSKGQVVIPREIRNALGIHTGTELLFSCDETGIIKARPIKRDIKMFFGRCKQNDECMTHEDMDAAIMEAVSNNDTSTRSKKK